MKRKKSSHPSSSSMCKAPVLPELPSPRLSSELIARVVDYLHDDVRSLKDCSLAAHVLLHHTRNSIFRVVQLNLRNCQKFLQILQTSPGAGPYVRELHVTVRPRESPPWVDRYLFAISEKLPNVRTLYMKSQGEAILTAAPFMGFRNIRTLYILGCELDSLNTLLSLIGVSPHLEVLDTTEMCVYRGAIDDTVPALPVRPRALKSVILNSSRGDADKFADWMIELGFHAKLEYLAFCPLQHAGLPPLGRLVKASGKALKHFKLALVGLKGEGGFVEMVQTNDILRDNVNLQTLELSSPAAFAKLYGADDVSAAWFPELIAQVASPYIEEIIFYLWDEDLEELCSKTWDDIAALLATSQFSSLKRLVFHVWGDAVMRETIIDTVKRKFARFDDRGMLRFDSTSDPACV